MGASGEVRRYSTVPIQAGTAINSDLLLDSSHKHLYIMTSNAVSLLVYVYGESFTLYGGIFMIAKDSVLFFS